MLARLRAECPAFAFETSVDSQTRIAIVDDEPGGAIDHLPDDVVARIVLVSGECRASRKFGELRIQRSWFDADPRSYLAFASDLVVATERAERLQFEFDFFDDIRDLVATSNIEVIFEKVTLTVLATLQLAHGTLLLHDPRVERFAVAFSNDPSHEDTGEFLPGVQKELLQQALESIRGFAVEEPEGEVPGTILMPIQLGDDVIGVIKASVTQLDRIESRNAVRALRYLQTVTAILGNVYQLTRNKDLAMRDDLTKAYNRRFFEAYLDEEMERSRRYSTCFSVIFLDLDDLKSVNNKYGHLAGSRTLQEVAKRIMGAVRAIDKVVRFGGDEFCILLPQTDADQAWSVADRVKRALNRAPFQLEADVEVDVTASFGIATYPLHASSKEDLIRAADAAMYRVKLATKDSIGIARSRPGDAEKRIG
ncbi:MAG: GGDEF domain-containing protein [Thermoanaerobaculia bacterium]